MAAADPPRCLDILAFGEPMVEFNQSREGDGRSYLQGFGGDTSNFAIAAARQGAAVGYWSAVGDDRHGRMLRALWQAEGIDHAGVATDPAAFTAVYVVSHGPAGHAFDFVRQGSAASRVGPANLPLGRIRGARVLHLSGISLAISASAREAGFAAMRAARDAGVAVSFDTNLRLSLWPSLDEARRVIGEAMRLADICLPSHDDVRALTGIDDPEALVEHCLGLGAGTVALKLGEKGALVADGKGRTRIEPFACEPVDATGAGDVFGGAFVTRVLAGDTPADAGRYAGVAAALSTEGYGAVAPIPEAAAVRAALARSVGRA